MDSVRDFTDEKRAELYDYIDEVTPEDWFQEFRDNIMDYFSVNALPYVMSDTDTYQKFCLNRFDTTKEQLDAIFAAAEQVDTDFAAKLRRLVESMAKAAEDVNKLAALWDDGANNHLIFGSPDAFAEHIHSNFDLESAWDHAMQRQVLALLDDPRFSQARWDSLSEDERKAFLNELLAEVQAIMGTSAPPEIRYEVPEDPDWLAWKGPTDTPGVNCVYIAEGVFGFMGPSREALMRAVFHEMRHIYQSEVAADYRHRLWVAERREERGADTPLGTPDGGILPPESNGALRHPQTSNETAQHWSEDEIVNHWGEGTDKTIMDYISSTVEYDAWNFAGQFRDAVEPRVTGLLPETWPGANYEGSWEVDNAWLNGN